MQAVSAFVLGMGFGASSLYLVLEVGLTVAFGVGVTMPAIMILGFELELVRVALVAVLGVCSGS